MTKKLHGILFDKDGTLLDFERTYAPACAAVIRDLAGGDALCMAQMAQAVDFLLAEERFLPSSVIIAGTASDQARAWAPILGCEPDESLMRRIDHLFDHHTSASAALIPGVSQVLAGLSREGFVLGVATNDSQAGAHSHITLAGIAERFSFVAGYDSGYGAKPGPGMVQAFARHCGCEPTSVALVGDSLHDMMAARAAGAVAIGVTTGMAGADTLGAHADFVISGLSELHQLAHPLRLPSPAAD